MVLQENQEEMAFQEIKVLQERMAVLENQEKMAVQEVQDWMAETEEMAHREPKVSNAIHIIEGTTAGKFATAVQKYCWRLNTKYN